MPRRKPAYRRVTPLASRRETQRRAALAILALVVVVGGLGARRLRLRRRPPQAGASPRSTPGQTGARPGAATNLAKVIGPGIDLVADDPAQALDAPDRRVPAARRGRAGERQRGRRSTRSGRRPWPASTGCTASSRSPRRTLFTFKPAAGAAPIDLGGMVRGPDGVPYVLDRATKTVYRIDLKTKKATVVVRDRHEGRRHHRRDAQLPRGGRPGPADPRLEERPVALAPGRHDGQGHADQGRRSRAQLVGRRHPGHRDVPADASRGPVQPVRRRSVRAADPRLLAGRGRQRLPGRARSPGSRPRATSAASPRCYIDGDIFAAERRAPRAVRRRARTRAGRPKAPGDDLLRPAPAYTLSSGPNLPADRDKGEIYGFDGPNAPDRRRRQGQQLSGAYKAQYRLAGGAPGLGGPPRHVRDPGRGRRAGDARLDLGRRGPPGVLEAVPDEAGQPVGQPVRRAVGQPEGLHEAEADPEADQEALTAAGP